MQPKIEACRSPPPLSRGFRRSSAQSLRITPEGERLVTQALVLLLQTERELLDALSEGERQILLELLHKVCLRVIHNLSKRA